MPEVIGYKIREKETHNVWFLEFREGITHKVEYAHTYTKKELTTLYKLGWWWGEPIVLRPVYKRGI